MPVPGSSPQFTPEELTNIATFATDAARAQYHLYGLTPGEEHVVRRCFTTPDARLLDIGCGYGRTTVPLHRMGYRVVGLDIVERMIVEARKSHPEVAWALMSATDLAGIRGAERWEDFVERDSGAGAPTRVYERLPFDHPLYILYSSGTTGLPKCLVHGAGGTLLQHLKEHVLHTDVRPGERVFYATTCGWMMWNWLVSALAVGCRVVLYDGAPLLRRPVAQPAREHGC